MLKAVVRLVRNYGLKSYDFREKAVTLKDKKLKAELTWAGVCSAVFNTERLEKKYGGYITV